MKAPKRQTRFSWKNMTDLEIANRYDISVEDLNNYAYDFLQREGNTKNAENDYLHDYMMDVSRVLMDQSDCLYV